MGFTPAVGQQVVCRGMVEFYAKGGKGLSFEEVFGEPLLPLKKRKR